MKKKDIDYIKSLVSNKFNRYDKSIDVSIDQDDEGDYEVTAYCNGFYITFYDEDSWIEFLKLCESFIPKTKRIV